MLVMTIVFASHARADSVAPASAAALAPALAPALDNSVCAPDGIAVGGYDLVSYHGEEGPTPGSAAHAMQHDGLTYLFATPANRQAFSAEPDRYLPTYRGWCSTNLSMGRLACPDYTNFKLEDGRLLLFERVGFTNGRDVWDSDPGLHRRQANDNFLRYSETPRSPGP